MKRLFAKAPSYGAPSKFQVGQWVRILEKSLIQATLDHKSSHRGLYWVAQQWSYCGQVFRVQKHIRRILRDDGFMSAISRTVILDGATCEGLDRKSGCGRACPLFFRDEWLEAATAPQPILNHGNSARYAVVRSYDEIKKGLDIGGGREGLMFMPEMNKYSGGRFRILKKVTLAHEQARDWPVRIPVYILEGLSCSGAVLGHSGGCDRTCALLWHRDWLVFESKEL